MSPAAYPEPTPVLRAQRGGLAPTAAPVSKMSFYDLQSRFWQLHAECSFKAADTHLYFFLLGQFNAARWPEKLFRKRNQIAAELGVDFKTLDTARTRLVERGLLTYEPGDKVKSAVWKLGNSSHLEGKNSPELEDSPQMEGNNSPSNGSNTPDSSHLEGKNSPLYKEEEKNTTKEEEKTLTVAARAAGPAGKKREAALAENSSAALPADEGQLVPPVARPPQKKPAKPKADAEPEHFAAFWEAYPRHDDRQKAVAAFARLSPEDQAAAPARAAEWIARRSDWISPEGNDYRPYPATWLNNKRWLDRPAIPSPATPTAHVFASPPGRRAAQTTRSESARQPIAEGLQHGPALTGSLADL